MFFTAVTVLADTSCIPGSCPRAGLCSTYCRCEEGRWKCCRVRKDFTELDPEEVMLHTLGTVYRTMAIVILTAVE